MSNPNNIGLIRQPGSFDLLALRFDKISSRLGELKDVSFNLLPITYHNNKAYDSSAAEITASGHKSATIDLTGYSGVLVGTFENNSNYYTGVTVAGGTNFPQEVHGSYVAGWHFFPVAAYPVLKISTLNNYQFDFVIGIKWKQ